MMATHDNLADRLRQKYIVSRSAINHLDHTRKNDGLLKLSIDENTRRKEKKRTVSSIFGKVLN